MFINLLAFLLLMVELLSPCDLSPINDNNTQHQVQLTNIVVNQPTSTAFLNTVSPNIKWIKTLKNITENGGRTVVLECQVKSFYPVSFIWYRYNNPLDNNRFDIEKNSFRSRIHLNNFKESQAGFYTCEVSNGIQTLKSTGFVRIKNPEIAPIDLPDDLLPLNEFQPEIISNNEELLEKLKCEIYSGGICRSIIGSKYISVTNINQKDIEQNLIDNMKVLSNECRQLLLPMICLFIYPICDNNQMNTRSICRKSCYYFQSNICMKGFSYPQQQTYSNFQLLHNIPTCNNLPPSSDDTSCLKIDPHRNVSSSSNTPPVVRLLLSSDSHFIALLCVCISVAIICLLILFFYCCCCHKRNNERHLSSCSSTLTPIKKSPYLTHTIPSSPFHSINSKQNHRNLTSSSSSTNTNLTNIHLRQTLLPKHQQTPSLCEIPFKNIRFLQEIGEGEFGRIYLGELIDNSNKCIIKRLQNENTIQDYSREIEIFCHIRHANISCLLGVCNQPEDALSLGIYEYLNNGDLHEYIISQRLKTSDLTDFLRILIQIVSGMIYLSEKSFLHNDLSTKNIFISEHMNIKITNIARYRRKYHLDYYKIANRLLPVRWMAIESLLSGVYSEMSDVWSFGVLIWEMFSYGIQPYYGQTNPEVIEMIRDGKFLTCPTNCPKKIYALMCSCWQEISEQRPTFMELMDRLRQLGEKSTVDDESISSNQVESPTAKYRTLLLSAGRTATQSMLVDRNSIRFES